MFVNLIRLLGILFFVWLFKNLVSFVMKSMKKKEPEKSTTGDANPMVKDPVCGMYMDSRLAVRMDSKNEAFYFCSEDCRNKYLSKPPGERMGAAPPR